MELNVALVAVTVTVGMRGQDAGIVHGKLVQLLSTLRGGDAHARADAVEPTRIAT